MTPTGASRPAGCEPAPSARAEPRRVHMIGNAHIDPVWLWPWQEGYQEARATFWSVIHRMEEYPDFVFTCDQVVLLDWVRESDPVLFRAIQGRAAEGRWVNTGGWWVEPDCNLPMGESFVRQGLYGQRFLLQHFDRAATVGMNVDPFGHNAMLPAILRGQGMDSYTFLRPAPHEESRLPDRPFWWVAPDGSRVLTSRIPFEYCSPGGDISWHADKALGQLDRSFDPVMVFYGVGNHGGGPTRANLDSIVHYDTMGTYGRLIMSSPRTYFDEVTARHGEDQPSWHGELQHHAPGCYSAHSAIKQWQRRAQHAVLTAERWAIIADVLGSDINPHLAEHRAELERAWKQVLFNQFHDVLPGSAIASAYVDARDQLGEAVAIAKRLTVRAHNAIARQIDIPMDEETQPVVVFNPHPWHLTAAVEINPRLVGPLQVIDHAGRRVNSQHLAPHATMPDPAPQSVIFDAGLPPLGYAVFRVTRSTGSPRVHDTELTATDTVLENNHLRVELDPRTGWLTSLLHKQSGSDIVAGAAGGHLQVVEDPSDTWGHHVVSYAQPGEEMAVDRIRLVESGPIRATIRVERSHGPSTVVEQFTLRHDSDAVQVSVSIDWRHQRHLLKLRCPVALDDPEATYEVPFASVQRAVDGQENPGQSWIDLTGHSPASGDRAGITVINNAKHGYDTSPAGHPVADWSPSIGITAVRSPAYAWNDPADLSECETYEFQDQERQRFTYLLQPHGRDWSPAQSTIRAAELGQPVRVMLESFHAGPLPGRLSFADDGADHVVITAIKGTEDARDAEDADVIVRAVEMEGAPGSATLSLPFIGRQLSAHFEPHQIRTFRVPRTPRRPVRETDLLESARNHPTRALKATKIERPPAFVDAIEVTEAQRIDKTGT